MEWVVRLNPMVAPGKMLRIVRQRTSQRVFTAFSDLEEENPSGDFWSPGYLIVSGTRSLPTELLHEYVNQTRQRQ
jgi:REP element-mobilizing transposase RayT